MKDTVLGRINTYRWHIEDPIPFRTALRFEAYVGGSYVQVSSRDVDSALVLLEEILTEVEARYAEKYMPAIPVMWSNDIARLRGDLRAWGDPPDGETWRIGIEHPLDPRRDFTTVAIPGHGGRSLATSSRTRRAWQTSEGRAHHLIANFAIGKEEQRGNRPDPEARGQSRIVVHIDLGGRS